MLKIKVPQSWPFNGEYVRASTVLTLCLRQSERLRQGTIRVRDVLGPGFGISDAKIQESLWHYYYDVEKSVNYLLSP